MKTFKLKLLLLFIISPCVAQEDTDSTEEPNFSERVQDRLQEQESVRSEEEESLNLLCVADKSTGFLLNEETDEWDYARFDVSDQRYIFSLNESGKYPEFNSLVQPGECRKIPHSVFSCQGTF